MRTTSSKALAGFLLIALVACSDEGQDGKQPGLPGDEDAIASQSFEATVEKVYIFTRRWRRWRAGEVFGTAWRELEFSPGSWTEANGPMGHGESYVSDISLGAVPQDQPITAYFRRPFYVANPSAVTSLTLGIMWDDGYVIYINGQEGGRGAMPTGTVTRTTLALGHEANNAYETRDISGSIGALRPCWNMLAVEIHQASTTSSDMVFDASLRGQVMDPAPPAPAPAAATEGFARRGSWRYHRRRGRPCPRPAGLIDELHLAIAPVLLGRGEHLFAGLDASGLGYKCTEHVATEKATHIVLSR